MTFVYLNGIHTFNVPKVIVTCVSSTSSVTLRVGIGLGEEGGEGGGGGACYSEVMLTTLSHLFPVTCLGAAAASETCAQQ